jgi:hypothetical protein
VRERAEGARLRSPLIGLKQAVIFKVIGLLRAEET